MLPGVGMNLQDHLELYVQHRCTQPITLYKAQKPFHMLKIGLEWLLKFTGMSEPSIRDLCASHQEHGHITLKEKQAFLLQ